MKTISCHRKYPITTNFLDTMLEHSVVIEEGETKLDAYRRGLKELDQIAAELRREASQGPVSVGVSFNDTQERTTGSVMSQAPQPTPTLNIEEERKEVMDTIDKCETLEELQAWKSHNQTAHGKIHLHYNKRLAELSKPKDFTDGLE